MLINSIRVEETTMSTSRFSSLGLAFLAAILAFSASASANHSWAGYHWPRQTNPVALLVGDNVSSTWDGYLVEAINDWNVSAVIRLTRTAGRSTPRTCRPTNGRIEACSAAYGSTGWLGIAQVWVSGTHITRGTTRLNDTYFNTPTYNTPAWRRLVTCQEIAHDFGLDHQDENFNNPNLGSCMDYTSDPDGPPSNEHPNSHDYAQLQTIYGHLDSAAMFEIEPPEEEPPAMSQIDFATPGQWGRLVKSSPDARAQVYEVDFGRGHRVITHVFWADPERDARDR
jgi:hypothetical protein